MKVIKKNTKFQLSSSKIMPARAIKQRDMGCEYYYKHYTCLTSDTKSQNADIYRWCLSGSKLWFGDGHCFYHNVAEETKLGADVLEAYL